jgi:alkylated DNA repair protein (DNA oxidative demethylase)
MIYSLLTTIDTRLSVLKELESKKTFLRKFNSPYGPMKISCMSFGKLQWMATPEGYGYFENYPELQDIPESFKYLLTLAAESDSTNTIFSNLDKYDVCLVNLYSPGSTLGLHIDKDEKTNLPIVSYSLGSSCAFSWKSSWGVKELTHYVLTSGELLVFGQEHRNIVHGVTAVRSDTDSHLNLKPGFRFNLTFRATGF